MQENVKKGKEWTPNAKQVALVDLLMDIENPMTNEAMCKEVDITPKTYWLWRKDENFIDYINKSLEWLAKSRKGEVWNSLVCKSVGGDVSAMKLFFEMTGDYKDRKELSGADGKAISFKWVDE